MRMIIKYLFGIIKDYAGHPSLALTAKKSVMLGESNKEPAFERLLLPEYISNDILQYLIE